MEGYYIPTAFFAFKSDIKKYEAREIIADKTMKYLRTSDSRIMTPLKINIFRIEEFETHYNNNLEAKARLRELNGRETIRPQELTFISSPNILFSYSNAQDILNKNPAIQTVLKMAKDMNLNYIIQGVYEDRSLTRVNYEDDTRAYDALKDIATRLAKTELYNSDVKWKFYAYNEKGELKIEFP